MQKSHWGKGLLVLAVWLMVAPWLAATSFAGQATVSWNPNSEGDLAGYKVHYGTQSHNYTQTVSVGNTTAAVLDGLTNGATYYFAVTAYDTSGNESGYSTEVSTIVASPADTTPPTISTIAVGSITSAGAVVTWTTNEAATAQVEYGTTTAYGSTTTLDSTLVTSHSRTLSGLQATTLYHFRVWSVDAASNVAMSADNTFTTAAAPDTTPPVISGVTASNLTSAGAVITWTTNEAATTQVDYGLTTSYGSSTTLNSTLVTSHSQTLSGLTVSTLYHYRVRSLDGAGNTSMSGDFTFTTTSASDTTPPVISGVTASNLTSTGAVITWTTNEAATTQVDYGTTSGYGATTTLNSALVTGHSQSLSGLTASTMYHYRVRSADGANNPAVSGDFTFTTTSASDTTPPGDPQNFTATPGDQQITLSWTNPSDGDFVGVRIRYRTDRYPVGDTDGTLLGDFTGQPTGGMSTIHTGLQNGRTYYYSASSYDLSGNFQSTAHASAMPSAAGAPEPSSSAGGCGGGAGFIGRNGPPGPGQLADLLVVCAVACGVLLRRRIKHQAMLLTRASHIWDKFAILILQTTVHLSRKERLVVHHGTLLTRLLPTHHMPDGSAGLPWLWRRRKRWNHQQWSGRIAAFLRDQQLNHVLDDCQKFLRALAVIQPLMWLAGVGRCRRGHLVLEPQ
jgi:hypothetical protein